jgi:hypothetical protein
MFLSPENESKSSTSETIIFAKLMNIMIYINLSPCYCTITAYIIYGRYIGAIEACYTILMCSIRYCNTFNIFSFILKNFTTKRGLALHFAKKHNSKYVFSSFLNSIMAMGLNVVSSGAYTGSV